MGTTFSVPAPGRIIIKGPIIPTAMGCSPEDAAEDAALAQAMSAATGYRLEQGRLVLTGGPGVKLHVARNGPALNSSSTPILYGTEVLGLSAIYGAGQPATARGFQLSSQGPSEPYIARSSVCGWTINDPSVNKRAVNKTMAVLIILVPVLSRNAVELADGQCSQAR
ncbi:hypothetical protein BFL28_18985 [Sphingomonas turrisvirgatae]|uniref:DUF306 domain-containing protein n=2 Tax=Sphingomonas turrisvirgatae TaxID=1888892 RepID=A0A1E3LTG7_9SPHN|nr:hypothetical protein BFL28_18985 [Sphingomonas turrisvirgatae]